MAEAFDTFTILIEYFINLPHSLGELLNEQFEGFEVITGIAVVIIIGFFLLAGAVNFKDRHGNPDPQQGFKNIVIVIVGLPLIFLCAGFWGYADLDETAKYFWYTPLYLGVLASAIFLVLGSLTLGWWGGTRLPVTIIIAVIAFITSRFIVESNLVVLVLLIVVLISSLSVVYLFAKLNNRTAPRIVLAIYGVSLFVATIFGSIHRPEVIQYFATNATEDTLYSLADKSLVFFVQALEFLFPLLWTFGFIFGSIEFLRKNLKLNTPETQQPGT